MVMEQLGNVFSSFGLSTAAGLNAYLPLLIVALTARFTDLITLQKPWDALEHPIVIVLLAILLIVEMTADKIPAIDTANDVINTAIRPAAGAVLFAAQANLINDVHPALALACGLLIAGTVHAAKSTARPVVTATTGGLGNPVVSVVEDVISAAMTVVSILAPVLVVFFMAAVGYLAYRWVRRRRAKRAAA
ncbi:MAG: DUF4126 domain-containing protein [Anaerolineae bacterium]|nr:DUF4126 domain-containing protein [Anaerolineae bacterium]